MPHAFSLFVCFSGCGFLKESTGWIQTLNLVHNICCQGTLLGVGTRVKLIAPCNGKGSETLVTDMLIDIGASSPQNIVIVDTFR